jgi:galactose mutarotase-like enzyme
VVTIDADADGPTSLRLSATGVVVTVDLVRGGRVASVVIDGREILVVDDGDPLRWGSYPMAPYAGRVRHGRFGFRGNAYRLPLGIPLHAIHGTVRHRRWSVVGDRTIATELGPDWPFAGRVIQSFDLEPGRFRVRMAIEADEPMPASIGWHPWFARRPARVGPEADGAGPVSSGDLELLLDAPSVYAKDGEDIASRDRVPPPPGPWDECFTDLRQPPVLRWPGFCELTIESDCVDWVVYTEPSHALCVEPQTAPPDSLNQDPRVVEPGAPLTAEMTWRWRSLAD